jgi:hypothetical protein
LAGLGSGKDGEIARVDVPAEGLVFPDGKEGHGLATEPVSAQQNRGIRLYDL